MGEYSTLQHILIALIPLLFGICLHEAAHGYIALLRGDDTAKKLGRVSLNPIRHIDLLGTIIFPIAIYILSAFTFTFGYAKPVPVDWSKLKNPRVDMAILALAGPAANLLMAILWGLVYKYTHAATGVIAALHVMGMWGININVLLMAFNMLPLPPLDGSRVVTSLLSRPAAIAYNKLEPYGLFILIFFFAIGAFKYIILPPVVFIIKLIAIALNIS